MTDADVNQSETNDALLLALFARSHEGMIAVGADGRVLRANDAAQGLLGRSIPAGARAADALGTAAWKAVAGLAGQGGCVPVAAGSFEASATLLHPARGSSAGILVRLAEASSAGSKTGGLSLGCDAAGLIHDLNNMLAVILGAASEGGDAGIAAIVRAAERGRSMLRAVLTPAAEPDASRVASLGLDDAIADGRATLAHLCGDGVVLRVELDAPGLRVAMSPQALERILLNLVVNARDASPRGGVVAVRTRVAFFEAAPSSVEAHGVVEVRNDGPGIPPDILARMGERFFTTKGPGHGTGLGLATVRDLLGEVGGRLVIRSEAGQGASVAIHIPADGIGPSASSAATILLVEDEDMLRGLVARALVKAGWRILQADSAEAALDALQTSPVDLAALVTDLALPGMSGAELVARVRATPGRGTLPVVFASGWPTAGSKDFAADSVTAILAKPFELRDLTSLLAAMTAPAHMGQPAARQKLG